MLKLPVFRGRLQMLSIRNEDFLSLCGAFEEASVTLERFAGRTGRETDTPSRNMKTYAWRSSRK